jgi:hypothetical protein
MISTEEVERLKPIKSRFFQMYRNTPGFSGCGICENGIQVLLKSNDARQSLPDTFEGEPLTFLTLGPIFPY